jgi:shikimate kinase
MSEAAEINEPVETHPWIRKRLGKRCVVIVGLMGAGKSTIGRKAAQMLELPFADADHEIESVSRMTIPELFEAYGEAEFRSLERRVIARLLKQGPMVLATGGGAYMNADTRRAIARNGVAVWLKAELDVLMERVSRKQNRPLLKTADPRDTMRALIEARYPVYGEADVTVQSRDEKKDVIASELVTALGEHLKSRRFRQAVRTEANE